MKLELQPCRSTPHRAMMGLILAALGGKLPPTLKEELTQSNPDTLAQIANNHQVHTIVQSAFTLHPELEKTIPHDLVLYFSLLYSENARRNKEAKQELITLGELFHQEGIDAVILKGGAEIIAPYYQDPAHRFISDLDILVPESRVDDAAELLFARGGVSNTANDATFEDHHHLPVIEGSVLPFRIELHKRIGDKIADEILPAHTILERSLPSGITGIRLPSPADRFTHHIIHGQIESQLYARTLLNLRTCVDHHYFQRALDAETLTKARQTFDQHGLLARVDGLDALSHWIFGSQNEQLSAPSNIWATKAVRNFGRPSTQKHFDSFMWLKTYIIRFLMEPKRRRHYLRKLFSIRGWEQFIAFHKDRLQRFM
ncbi:MAG: nucleotidyltransferase family protein [Rickettsiales bacterium]|nr:nucleotidyltransferase family protein [Rickettsiales bacterium]